MFLVLAHRGASMRAPENTFAAFRLAFEEGAHGLELDVHLSKDGVPVVIHDARLERTTDGHGFVAQRSVAELNALDAGSWFDAGFAGARIPTLAEVLAEFASRGLLNLELKPETGPHPDLVPAVLRVLEEHGVRDGVLLSSFHAESIRRVRELAPHLATGVILLSDVDPEVAERFAFADGFGLPAYAATREGVRAAKDAGKDAFLWVINDAVDARAWRDAGARGVITDDPAALRAL